MPAVYNSLVKQQHIAPHKAWRISFVVPGILIVFVALCLLLLCEDTPTGRWSDRALATEATNRHHSTTTVKVGGALTDAPLPERDTVPSSPSLSSEKPDTWKEKDTDAEAQPGSTLDLAKVDTARGEVVQKPTFSAILRVMFSLQTLVPAACYFCTFGAELSINSILGNYYMKNFPKLGLQETGNWAAMFGLLNGVTRPLGGFISDLAYRRTNSVWAKKAVLHTYGVLTGVFLIIIGVLDSKNQSTMFGLVAGMAFFLEGGNGADFGLVPHVHPYANGVVSGFTGAAGNFGGIIFAIIFRYNGKAYGKVFWIIGVITIGINLAVSWIRPVPKGQLGGR